MARSAFGDLVIDADEDAPGQGQLHGMLDRSLGPFQLLLDVQIGLPLGRKGGDGAYLV